MPSLPCLKPSCGSTITFQTKSTDFAGPAKPHRTRLPAAWGISSPSACSVPSCHQASFLLIDMQGSSHLRLSLLLSPSCGRFSPFIHTSAQMSPLQRELAPSKPAPQQRHHLRYLVFTARLSTSSSRTAHLPVCYCSLRPVE